MFGDIFAKKSASLLFFSLSLYFFIDKHLLRFIVGAIVAYVWNIPTFIFIFLAVLSSFIWNVICKYNIYFFCILFCNLITIIFNCIIIHHRCRQYAAVNRNITFYARTNWRYEICAVCSKFSSQFRNYCVQTNHSFQPIYQPNSILTFQKNTINFFLLHFKSSQWTSIWMACIQSKQIF